jgi:hypothetical protein
MMFPETVCAGAPHPGTEPEVMSTPAGYYIGFRDEDGLPYSRETGYFATASEADDKLKTFKEVFATDPTMAQELLPFVRR